MTNDPKKFRPTIHRLLLKMDPLPGEFQGSELRKTASGLLFLPPSGEWNRSKVRTGVIFARGPGKPKKVFGKEQLERVPIDPELEIGSRVLVGYYIGDLVGRWFGGKPADWKIVSDDQILGFSNTSIDTWVVASPTPARKPKESEY